MTYKPGKQTIAMHILPNISRSKDNQTMKFGQVMEYNMGNYFLENSFTKCDGKTIPKPFSKNSKLSISLDQFLFIVGQVEGYRNILKLSCRSLSFISYKAFVKNKKRSGTTLCASFCAWYLKKNISFIIFY